MSMNCYLLRIFEGLVTNAGIFVSNFVGSSLSEDRFDTRFGIMDIFLEEGHRDNVLLRRLGLHTSVNQLVVLLIHGRILDNLLISSTVQVLSNSIRDRSAL